MINAEMICHHDVNHVSFLICHMMQRPENPYQKKKGGSGVNKISHLINAETTCHHD